MDTDQPADPRDIQNPLQPPPGAHPSWSRIWIPRIAGAVLVAMAALGTGRWIWEGSSAFLVLLVFTVFLAFALEPVVHALESRGMKRGLAAGLTEFAAIVALGVISWAFLTLLIDQFTAIAEQLPVWMESAITWLNSTFGLDLSVPESIADAELIANNITSWLDDAAGLIASVSSGLASGMASAFAILFLLYYAMADGHKMRRALLSPLPPDSQLIGAAVWDTAIEKTGGYVYSRIILAALSATFQAIAFYAIGLDNALALGIFVGLVSQLIPNIGTIIGGALPVFVGLVQDPILGLWALVVVVIYQQLENYVFVPRVTRNTMDLHPAISFGAVIVGAQLLGFTGLLLSLPVVATIQSLITAYGRRYELAEELRDDLDEAEEEPA